VYIADQFGNILPNNVAGNICVGSYRFDFFKSDFNVKDEIISREINTKVNLIKTRDIGYLNSQNELVYLEKRDYRHYMY
jgi:hypothetical protein